MPIGLNPKANSCSSAQSQSLLWTDRFIVRRQADWHGPGKSVVATYRELKRGSKPLAAAPKPVPMHGASTQPPEQNRCFAPNFESIPVFLLHIRQHLIPHRRMHLRFDHC
jgi:hypothetical protein